MAEDGEPIHCHACATFSEIQDGECANCGADQSGYSTAEESGKRFREIVDRYSVKKGLDNGN